MDVNNQGLNLPSNLQNLDVRNELLSTEVGSGVKCAYSLRDLTGSNKKAVRVRRMPEDSTSSGDTGGNLNDERIFGGQEVQAGYVEDWVNGKLENTLPCDVATASAGYSLRKIKADYSGDAVRIRRSSDDVEVDVAFDSEGKVSANSAITNVAEEGGESGSTTATDLNGFLNETLTVGTAVNGTDSFPYDQFTANGNTGFNADNKGGGTSSAGFPYSFADGDVIVIRFTVSNFDSESGLSPQIRGTNGTGSVTSVASGGTIFTANGTYTDTLTGTADGTHLMFADGNTGSYTISNFEVLSHTHQAFVHTWYDQAGSNDAVQETAGNQPKIAEGGALIDGINFDANTDGTSPDFLQVATRLGVTTDHFVSVVFNGYQTDSSAFGAFLNTRNSNAGFQYGIASTAKVQSFFYAGAGNNANSSSSFTLSNNSAKRLVTFDKDGNNLTGFGNATTNGISLSNGVNTPSTTVTNIGVGGNVGTTTSLGLRANINELIVYETDQADNRFKIESNINNYYGLYNDANEMSTDWSDDPTAPYGSAFTSNGKDGYTIDYSAGVASTRARWQFEQNVPSGDVIYYSFNASITSGTPAIILKQSNGTSNANSSSVAITNGFNSGSITTNAEAVYFAIGDTEGTQNYSISDFKVSRIARNGFVETWYDQSNNGFNMTQASASLQPFIIQNGGSHNGVFAPRNTATSGSKIHLESFFRNQNFPANTSKVAYIVVGENITAQGNGNDKGTIFGSFRGVANYTAGQLGLVVEATNKLGLYNGLASSSLVQKVHLTTSGDNAIETNKVIMVASANNRSVTLFSNTQTTTEDFVKTGGGNEDLNLDDSALNDADKNYLQIFAPNRDGSPRANNYSFGTVRECILIAGDSAVDNLTDFRNDLNNYYQYY